ncbi:hypothetical protein AK830_g771 [Neonectria ditissima]|uniref:Uncharacterized protein n=1 Tax=Neonectria ditissima TaxID=78410 RepID=A0A0P7BVG0_9HYPO|nr:hypothetical protein AK830_g771 [Neonectria ditissima]
MTHHCPIHGHYGHHNHNHGHAATVTVTQTMLLSDPRSHELAQRLIEVSDKLSAIIEHGLPKWDTGFFKVILLLLVLCLFAQAGAASAWRPVAPPDLKNSRDPKAKAGAIKETQPSQKAHVPTGKKAIKMDTVEDASWWQE